MIKKTALIWCDKYNSSLSGAYNIVEQKYENT